MTTFTTITDAGAPASEYKITNVKRWSQALRRSIKGDKDKDKDRERNGQNVSNPAAVQKLAVAIMPPKKVSSHSVCVAPGHEDKVF